MMNLRSRIKTGDLEMAISHAMTRLRRGEFATAREQAEEILRHYPGEFNGLFILAAAIRGQGDNQDALQRLEHLVRLAPDFALAQQELGLTYAVSGKIVAAIQALQCAVRIQPDLADSWKLLSELCLVEGDEESAAEAFNQHLLVASVDPELIRAVKLFQAGKVGRAEKRCRRFLQTHPADVTALRLLAAIAMRLGIFDEAEKLLNQCLQLAPDFHLARLNYADVLRKQEKPGPALAQIDLLLEKAPYKFSYLVLRVAILVSMRAYTQALSGYEYLLTHFPPRAKITLGYGHVLAAVGQQHRAIAAYRQATSLQPGFGNAWWSLAKLKTYGFADNDIRIMREEIEKPSCTVEDRVHLCFALGKALGDRKQYDESFSFYQQGNGVKQNLENYDPARTRENVQRTRAVFSEELLTRAAGQGPQAATPIFIVGFPRSGSTLLEQILSSHSQVDGTGERARLAAVVRRLEGNSKQSAASRYPEIVRQLDSGELRALGEAYLDGRRRQDTAFFIDRTPHNFPYIGLIHLILPHARIIDARRHPMAACFSAFTQLFARDQAFTCSLSNLGRYYRDYIDMMEHWDQVLPGKVLLMQYEALVADAGKMIERMLAHCGLPMEDSCFQVYATQRTEATDGSGQVQQSPGDSTPDHWRNYASHLEALRQGLGSVLDRQA